MSRRTLTLALAGFLVVLLAAVAALLPVPYVAITPGPVTNTLGSVGKTKLIQIEGHETFPTKGQLDLTTISAFGGPTNRLDLVTALRGWIDDAGRRRSRGADLPARADRGRRSRRRARPR